MSQNPLLLSFPNDGRDGKDVYGVEHDGECTYETMTRADFLCRFAGGC